MPQANPNPSRAADSQGSRAPRRPTAAVGNVPFTVVLLSGILTIIPPTRAVGFLLLLVLAIPTVIVWFRARKLTDGSRGLTTSTLVIGAAIFVIGIVMIPSAETPGTITEAVTAPPAEQAVVPPAQPLPAEAPAPAVVPVPQPVIPARQPAVPAPQPIQKQAPAPRVAPAPVAPKPVQQAPKHAPEGSPAEESSPVASSPATSSPGKSSGKPVHPGAYCSQGDIGFNKEGEPMVCGSEDAHGRYHWRRA